MRVNFLEPFTPPPPPPRTKGPKATEKRAWFWRSLFDGREVSLHAGICNGAPIPGPCDVAGDVPGRVFEGSDGVYVANSRKPGKLEPQFFEEPGPRAT